MRSVCFEVHQSLELAGPNVIRLKGLVPYLQYDHSNDQWISPISGIGLSCFDVLPIVDCLFKDTTLRSRR